MKREQILSEFFDDMASVRRFMLAAHAPGLLKKGMPTRAQFGVMNVLAQEKAKGIKDIAQCLGMTSSAATQLVESLVKEGVLVRKMDSSDRRKIGVSLTKKGKTMLERAKKVHQEKIIALFKPLSDSELMQLQVIQKKILTHLSTL